MTNEVMEFDVVIVGAGPAGLATAIQLKKLALANNTSLEVCLLEKGSQVGAHILSGAILDTRAMDELLPDWRDMGAPVRDPVSDESFLYLKNGHSTYKIPQVLLPQSLSSKEDYIVNLGELCVWLAAQAQQLGVHIFTSFAATEILYRDNKVIGVSTGEKGRSKNGERKSSFLDSMELHAKFTVLSEGSHGHLGKQAIEKYKLDENCAPQHYAVGFKEIWQSDKDNFKPGKVIHSIGWPLNNKATGGGFMYSQSENQISVGFIVDLNYKNPYLRPYDEFQSFKQHKKMQEYLKGAKRIAYGARSISKGGYYSLPKMSFPGGFLIGCDAGTFNMGRLKGIHTAMKSGMLAAESIISSMQAKIKNNVMESHTQRLRSSWLWKELYQNRNRGGAVQKFGVLAGGTVSLLEDKFLNGSTFLSIKNNKQDHASLKSARLSSKIEYPPYDGEFSFDISSSLVLANISHNDDQPCHILLDDKNIPINISLPEYAEPAQRYCSAGVYEVITTEADENVLTINAQNCIHCKVCDIKDPLQNYQWSAPEGGSGPNYRNM